MKLVDRNTAAWRLFHLKYPVLVPELSAYSPDYLRSNPLPSTGDRALDDMRESNMVATKHTAAGLAMLLSQGYPFGLLQIKDCVQIYSDIQNHLNDWNDQTLSYIHPNEFPPIDELRMLESLAIEVYVIAKKLEPNESVRSKIIDSLISMNRSRNLVSTNRWLRDRNRDQRTKEIKPYDSIVDKIERYIAENS